MFCWPDLVYFWRVAFQTRRESLNMAFDISAKKLGVTGLLDAEGIILLHNLRLISALVNFYS